MTTRETLRPSWRDSENFPFEFESGMDGGSAFGSVATGADALASGTGGTRAGGLGAAVFAGDTVMRVGGAGAGENAGCGISDAGTAGAVAGAAGDADARRRSMTSRYGP